MIAPHHEQLLEDSAIPAGFAAEIGVTSVLTVADLPPEFAHWGAEAVPGLLFPWVPAGGGETVWQLRPDRPIVESDGDVRKYLWPAGQAPVLAVYGTASVARLAWMRDDPEASASVTVLIVEGTKQAIAAAAVASEQYLVLGMTGIWGYRSKETGLVADMAALPKHHRVVIVPDADFRANPDVWEGTRQLRDQLIWRGAPSVRVAEVPGGAKTGLDDALALWPQEDRGIMIDGLVGDAADTLGKKPSARRPAGTFVWKGKFYVEAFDQTMVDEVGADRIAVVGSDHSAVGAKLATWHEGVFRTEHPSWRALQVGKLADDWSVGYADRADEFLVRDLLGRSDFDHRIPDLLPFRGGVFVNGWVDYDEPGMPLHPHDPSIRTTMRFEVPWQPEAECPGFEAWLSVMAPGEGAGRLLCELLGQIFDLSAAPDRHALLLGASKSGKSTVQRMTEAAVGPLLTANVSLHLLAANRFAGSYLRGRRLNSCADLSAASIADLATFKQLTGGDMVYAEQKNEKAFAFRSQALNLFSTNDVPPVAEASAAYVNRVLPVIFPNSVAGREDSRFEQFMMGELPGIVRRLVTAHLERVERRSFTPVDPETEAIFRSGSDRVFEFVRDQLELAPGYLERGGPRTPKREMYGWFRGWARERGYAELNHHSFTERMRTAGVREAKTEGTRCWRAERRSGSGKWD